MAQPLPIKKRGTNGGKTKALTAEQRRGLNKQFFTMATDMANRSALADKLGKSYFPSSGGTAKRDLYKTLGYELSPNFNSYYARYRRQDIAKAVVEALPNACWRLKPTVVDSEEQGSEFELQMADLVRTKHIWQYLSRADRIAGIGNYGGVLMGFDDGKDPAEPILRAGALLYLRPYTQEYLTVKSQVEDPANERYGLPETYTVSISGGSQTTGGEKSELTVHYSRILLISEGLVEDDIYGTPRLECVLNRLQDLELITGGSAEMFWRGAFPGYAFKAQSDAQFAPESLADLEDEIQDYLHELRRYVRLQGIDIQELQPQVADPTNHFDVLVTLIAAAARIPKRILLGSERGELASGQDERAWLDRIDERRTDHVEPNIIRPLVDTLIAVGTLPAPPSGEYNVVWPLLVVTGEKDRMEIARTASEALAKYVATPGLSSALPFEMYLKKFMGFTDDEIQQAKELLGADLEASLGVGDGEPLEDEGASEDDAGIIDEDTEPEEEEE